MIRLNGHRGWYLVLLGIAYIALGYNYALVPDATGHHTALAWMVDVIPIRVFGYLWSLAGGCAIGSGFLRTGRDRFGFAALAGVAFAWGAAFAVAWLAGGEPRAWSSAVIFWAIAPASVVVSGMQNRPHQEAV